jgi:hypothetical protein
MTVIQEPSEPREALDTQIHHAVDAVAGLVEVAAGTSGLRDRIIRLLVTFATYEAAGTLGILWLDAMAGRDQGNTSASLTALWLAPGFGVACLLRYGRRAWPAIAAGSIVLWGFIRHAYLPLIVVESAGEALSIVLIVTLLRSWGFRPTLDRYKDSLLLIAALAIGRTVSSAIDMLSVIGAAWVTTSPRVAAGLAAAGAVRHGDALAISPDLVGFAARWWANTVSGSLLVVPLRALRFHTAARRRGYHGELALLIVGIAIWIAIGLLLPFAGVWPALVARRVCARHLGCRAVWCRHLHDSDSRACARRIRGLRFPLRRFCRNRLRAAARGRLGLRGAAGRDCAVPHRADRAARARAASHRCLGGALSAAVRW